MIPRKAKGALTCDRSVGAPDAADLADLVRGAMACGDSSKLPGRDVWGCDGGREREFVFVSFGFRRVRPFAQKGLAWSARDFFLFNRPAIFTLPLLLFSSSTNVI